MTITARPSSSASVIGGSISLPERSCDHGPTTVASPWMGEPGTVGTVTVVGAGKMGLPLAAQYASHGWSVIAVDVNPAVVESINAGRAHVAEEPGLAELVSEVHAKGLLRATTDGAAAARESDVLVLIVPVMLDDQHQPDYRFMDAAVDSIGPGVCRGATVIFETTLPVGDTRERYAPRLAALSGLEPEREIGVAFSPERLFSGAVFRNLATYPKLVGGVGPESTQRAARFYASVLDAEVVAMSSAEAAELSKLAETTYRDLNIAFANELAQFAGRRGIDVLEVIRAANSQPYSHIHQPGLGVGGHCIPVYPHFLLSRAPEMALVELGRRVNDGQVDMAIDVLRDELGELRDVEVLVLGLTYREGVNELAYSRALPLITGLTAAGVHVSAWDPLLDATEISRLGASPWTWGSPHRARAIVLQTADPMFRALEARWFPELGLLLDGRNSVIDIEWPDSVRVLGIGVPPQGPLAARG
jgi:nucleotide sugar dehydrogenase